MLDNFTENETRAFNSIKIMGTLNKKWYQEENSYKILTRLGEKDVRRVNQICSGKL